MRSCLSKITEFNGNGTFERSYLRTTDAYKYGTRDFVATVQITNGPDAGGMAFFGLGDGRPSDYYSSPCSSPPFVYMMFFGQGWVARNKIGSVHNSDRVSHYFSTEAKDDRRTIRAKLAWTAATGTAVFSINADNDGVYEDSVAVVCPGLALPENQSRLFIGGANGVTFSDFNVTVGPRRREGKGGADAMNGP